MILYGNALNKELDTVAEYTKEEVTAYQAGRWGTTIEAVRSMSLADNLHHSVYGDLPGQCPVARTIEEIANASLAERQGRLFEAVHKMTTAEKLHLILWGAGACPDVTHVTD